MWAKSLSGCQALRHFCARPRKLYINTSRDTSPGQKRLCACAVHPRPAPARSTLGRRLRGAGLAGTPAVTDGVAAAAAAAAQGSAEPPLHRSAAMDLFGDLPEPERAPRPPAGKRRREEGGAGVRGLRHFRAIAASVLACASRGRSDRAVPVRASRGPRTKPRAKGSGHAGFNLSTARLPAGCSGPGLTAYWKPRELRQVSTPGPSVRGACTANPGCSSRPSWGSVCSLRLGNVFGRE